MIWETLQWSTETDNSPASAQRIILTIDADVHEIDIQFKDQMAFIFSLILVS